jgi:hypothetical protein
VALIKYSQCPHPSLTISHHIPTHTSLSLSLSNLPSDYIAVMSKEVYDNEAPGSNGRATYVEPATGMESKAGVLNEAGEIYGSLETAEEYGYVTRG